MTKRERLIELMTQAENEELSLLEFEKKILADYLLANGVTVLPVKVGDIVYGFTKGGHVCDLQIEQIYCCSSGIWKFNCWSGKGENRVGYELSVDDFGKIVFLTRKEAERVLKGGVNNG